ncbi:DUF4082 domain-containing protein [Agromyces sp. NPDC056965]|uniref:DUF4082 domain-containing protein n=1 Tax=Agromyces sp. NPDC056965 TaxID=3345983 RepID=UPI003635A6C8
MNAVHDRVETGANPGSQTARRRLLGLAAVVALTAALGITTSATSADAAACANPIACENALPGTDPSVWQIDGAGDDSIQGFATDISVNVGSTVDFKIDTNARAYTIDIYRTGWYQGLGARKITSVAPKVTLPQSQPQCITDVSTELYDCGNWRVSASWAVPSTAVSGVYVALLTRADTGGQSHITFIVRDSASTAAVMFQTSDPTWHAYNLYGGSDFYAGAANGRAYKLSYNRPFSTRDGVTSRDFYFSAEFAMVRFLERNGYDVTYASGVDTARNGAALLKHEVFLSVGHDEYWSGAQRANIQAARDAGVDIQFLGGNVGYWRTRYEPSADASASPYRTLVSYKETWSNGKVDPSPEWTGTWRDPRFATTANGGNLPENQLLGTMYMSNHSDLPVTVSAQEGKTRLWRNTVLATKPAGSTTQLAAHTVGYESDEDIDNGRRPPGLIRLSTTTGAVPEYLQDFGNRVAPGVTEHHVTLYRAKSGALVFSSGSIQWTWGLDQGHDGDGAAADPRMQQAEVNLLADMGAFPATLQSGLVAATRSTDTVAPTLTISSPATGTQVANGSMVTLTGTASDTGGVVAGVEVSTDGGASWHPATGLTNWSYSFALHGMGEVSVLARAIDDSANFPAAGTEVKLRVTGPYSAFGAETPVVPDAGDGSPVELGLRFTPMVGGFVQGVRFYKSRANTGTHTGTLWAPNGTQLATGTFTGESAEGWQVLRFATPVEVSAGTTYTASYWAPNGHYAAVPHAFTASGLERDPFLLAGGLGSQPAGVFGIQGWMPAESWDASNYYVDVLFDTNDTSPVTAVSRWPLPGSSSVATNTTISATLSKPVTSYEVRVVDELGSVVAGATVYDAATRTLTFTPTNRLAGFVTYTVQVTATTATGLPLGAGATWTFRTAKPDPVPGACPCGLFTDSTVPGVLDNPEQVSLVLGTAFKTAVNGKVTGVSFYKGAGNTGTHTGGLWTASGTLLATGTFTAETTSGWQTLTFATPVAVTAGTEYIAAYRAPAGHYSATIGALASPLSVGPLSTTAGAGAYSYGGDFPSSRSTSSYLVDVVFDPAPTALAVVSTTPAENATDVTVGSTISVAFNAKIADGSSLTASAAGTSITGTTTLSADRKLLTFDPATDFAPGATVTVSLKNVTAFDGPGSLADRTWSFQVTAPVPPDVFRLFSDRTPEVPAANDPSSVELGVAFTSTTNGEVTGIRFYKGAGNTGTHTGSLWDAATGQRLATVTFAAESPSGWQQASFATPVAIQPGREYVASYLAPNGNYAYTSNDFAVAQVKGPLTAVAELNGRYRYGAGGEIPAFSWNRSNYFVDVVFRDLPDPPKPAVLVSSVPASGAALVDPLTAVRAVLGGDLLGGTPQIALSGPGGAVPGVSAWDAGASTVRFTPTSPLPASTKFTATVTVAGGTGNGSVGGGTWSFTTASAVTGPVFFAGQTPSNTSWDDATTVQLGVRFTTTAPVRVSAIRFYKAPGDAATHQVFLWGANTVTPLATATSTAETASGWQTVQLPTSVVLEAGVEYRATYLTTRGRYAADLNGLAASVVRGSLATLPNGGVYTYAGTSYPGQITAHNLWADIVVGG